MGGHDAGPVEEDDGGMSNTFDSMPVEPAPPATPSPVQATPRRKRGVGHILAIVAGCMLIFPGLGILAGGSAIAVAQAVATDDDGYYRFTLDRVESDGVAVAATDLWLDDVDADDSPWVLDWVDLDVRLRVEGAVSTDEVFVGIARTPDVERYLAEAAFSRVVSLDEHAPQYRQVTGDDAVGAPSEQDFWTVSTEGMGEQELTWDARGGRWSVVVMNADGSPAVAADVEIGAKSGAVTPIAVILIVIGGAMVATAIVLIIVGARGRRSPAQPIGPQPVDPSPLPPPAPAGSAQPVEEERSTSPVA